MRLRSTGFVAALIGASLSASASAGVTQIPADAQRPFKHQPSGIVIPAIAGGLPRTAVEAFDDKQLDFAAEYRTQDDREDTTLYIFRKVTGDVPVWFDRIQRAIEARDIYASPKLAGPPTVFTPPGQSNGRGLMVLYTPGSLPWTSTGAAMTATGDWFVSIRASSQSLSPAQLASRMNQTLASLRLPREQTAAPDAYVVQDCPSAMPQGPDAAPVKDTGSVVLMSALSASIAGKLADKGTTSPPPRWCRDAFRSPAFGVYRPNAATDRYLVAFEDAGRGMTVVPNGLAGILAGAKGSDSPT